MICPECRGEFREGILRCPDCAVDLLDALDSSQVGDPLGRVSLVTVLLSGDLGELALAESLLESEGIHYFKSGDDLQDLFDAGRLGLGFNPLVGPVKLQVRQEDVERTRELLTHIQGIDPGVGSPTGT